MASPGKARGRLNQRAAAALRPSPSNGAPCSRVRSPRIIYGQGTSSRVITVAKTMPNAREIAMGTISWACALRSSSIGARLRVEVDFGAALDAARLGQLEIGQAGLGDGQSHFRLRHGEDLREHGARRRELAEFLVLGAD
jgi:hypothetical protein